MQPVSLAAPSIAEATRAQLGQALENCLAPLVEYCDAQRANENLSEVEFQHVFALGQAIDALVAYDQATETLLQRYRTALASAQATAEAQALPLEHHLLCQLPPAQQRAYREKDPVYRLGYARGHHEASQRYERVVHLYADHATLHPSPTYVPSPLITRVQQHLASPSMQAYAALPLATRQALNSFSPADLHAHVEPRKTQA